MELFLQFGYGMMGLSSELLGSWKDGGVILSPRDLKEEQLLRTGEECRACGVEVMIDPQCFIKESDYPNLTSHTYWSGVRDFTNTGFFGGKSSPQLIADLYALNQRAKCSSFIVPGVLAVAADELWSDLHQTFCKDAAKLTEGKLPLFATLALSAEVMQDESAIEAVVENVGAWPVQGFYVVAESPGYLVDDPTWLSNLLILCSGLKLLRRRVLVGYCNHQMTCLATAKVDAIASGTWMNVRSFRTDKFFVAEEQETSRRAKGGWYYCPQAMTEFKMPYLDTAKKRGILARLKPPPELQSAYMNPLFDGGVPSVVKWGEAKAFRHYLHVLRLQARQATRSSFDETCSHYQSTLDAASTLLKFLEKQAVRGAERDFSRCIEHTKAAIDMHSLARRARLRRSW